MEKNCALPFLWKTLALRAGVAEPDLLSAIACQKNGMWCMDTSHPAMAAIAAWSRTIVSSRGKSQKATPSGPGTELKKLLARVGITAAPACACNARARTMDANGCDWCEANLGTIVGWLREEATKRGLPFLDAAGRLLVKRAIRNARKAAS
jgi:hypothetical protein